MGERIWQATIEAIHTSRVGPRLASPVVIQYLTGGPGSRPADLQFHRANNSYPDLITASFIIFSFRSVELSSEMKPKYITTIFDQLNTDNSLLLLFIFFNIIFYIILLFIIIFQTRSAWHSKGSPARSKIHGYVRSTYCTSVQFTIYLNPSICTGKWLAINKRALFSHFTHTVVIQTCILTW